MTHPKNDNPGEKDKARDKARPALTRDAIVTAALEIVDREGLDALSMRRLGSALEVDPMAIYYHIPNKSALLDGLMEAVMGEIDLTIDDPSQPAPERIRIAAHIYHDVLMAHPHAVEVIAVRNLNTPESFRPVEFLLEIFLGAGFSPAQAMAAVNIFARFVRGYVLSEVQQMLTDAAANNGCNAFEALQQVLPAEEFPRMHEVMIDVASFCPEDEFDLGLRALIRGMFEIASEPEEQVRSNTTQASEKDEIYEECE